MKTDLTIKKVLLKVSELLKKAEIKGFQRESGMILSEIINKPIEYIYTHSEDEISEENLQKSLNLAEKRASGMPMAYILGRKEFFGLDFNVSTDVLIPRPETEMIVEEAINWVKKFGKDEELLILDIGTGSGCIPIAIAKNVRGNVDFLATDFSEKALEIAEKNARINKVKDRIKFKKSDLLSAVDCSIFRVSCSMLITANLPYLSKEVYGNSPSSVQDFEPKEALISGVDGLDHYRELLNQVIDKNISGITKSLEILLEISPEQKELIEDLIVKEFGDQVEISVEKDLAGKWRLVRIKSCKHQTQNHKFQINSK